MTASPDRTAREPTAKLRSWNDEVSAWEYIDVPSDDVRLLNCQEARDAVTDLRIRIAELEAENARLARELRQRDRAREDWKLTYAANLENAEARATAAEAKLRAAWEAGRDATVREAMRLLCEKEDHPAEIGVALYCLQPPAEYAGEVAR